MPSAAPLPLPLPPTALPRSATKLLSLAERARRGLPLFAADDPELPDDVGIREGRSRNGSTTGIVLVGRDGTVLSGSDLRAGRRRSARELALARDSEHRRREAQRKRALRRNKVQQWRFVATNGPFFDVAARTLAEARTLAAAHLHVRRRQLPRGLFALPLLDPRETPCCAS